MYTESSGTKIPQERNSIRKFTLFGIETILETEIPVTTADTQEKQNSGEVWKLNWGQKLEVLHDQLKSLDFLFYPIY